MRAIVFGRCASIVAPFRLNSLMSASGPVPTTAHWTSRPDCYLRVAYGQ
jgi:hypothetical protein